MTERWELTVQISDDEAEALSLVLKRLTPLRVRTLSVGDAEAARMHEGIARVREALVAAGVRESRHA